MRYYQAEHEAAYREIERLRYTQWNDLFDERGAWTYDNFQNRAFLERVIPQLDVPAASTPSVFEYGCGTGPAACFLAARGFEVDAIDLIPEAIAIARRMAEERACLSPSAWRTSVPWHLNRRAGATTLSSTATACSPLLPTRIVAQYSRPSGPA